jgi:hypothetical protein
MCWIVAFLAFLAAWMVFILYIIIGVPTARYLNYSFLQLAC